jgi:hypothetical protein
MQTHVTNVSFFSTKIQRILLLMSSKIFLGLPAFSIASGMYFIKQ